jgi:hypothetical protein
LLDFVAGGNPVSDRIFGPTAETPPEQGTHHRKGHKEGNPLVKTKAVTVGVLGWGLFSHVQCTFKRFSLFKELAYGNSSTWQDFLA